MSNKRACIVVDLRTGEHVTRIPGLVAVLAAAGWKTEIALKEYGGETIHLAEKAAKDGCDLVLGFGGDGTLNAILNGLMYAEGKSVAADIPGGTFNVWAGAIGLPTDPVKAALALIDSDARKIDLGHIEVTDLTKGNAPANVEKAQEKFQQKAKRVPKNRQYFLMNVGLGMDARMMNNISKPLKYRFGPLAFDLATLKELPNQRPFPVEVQQLDEQGKIETSWQGEAWQIYISKVPLFSGSIRIEQEARADDGLLYLCLITANGPVKTAEQLFSILTQHIPDKETTKYLRGKHFSVRVPASVDMHVDGSISGPEEFLEQANQERLPQGAEREQVLVSYHFNIEPKALSMAIPRGYRGPLFGKAANDEQSTAKKSRPNDSAPEAAIKASDGEIMEQGESYPLTVIGVTPYQEKENLFIVAGTFKKPSTDETVVFAARISKHTTIQSKTGEQRSSSSILELQEGQKVVVIGEKTKRGVIKASSLTIES